MKQTFFTFLLFLHEIFRSEVHYKLRWKYLKWYRRLKILILRINISQTQKGPLSYSFGLVSRKILLIFFPRVSVRGALSPGVRRPGH